MGGRDELVRLPGIKEVELTALGPCRVCRRSLLDPEKGHILFYRLRIERCGWDAAAVQRQVGLGMLLGGSAVLAHAMGPDEDLAKVIAGPHDLVVHEGCADQFHHLLELFPEPETAEDES